MERAKLGEGTLKILLLLPNYHWLHGFSSFFVFSFAIEESTVDFILTSKRLIDIPFRGEMKTC